MVDQAPELLRDLPQGVVTTTAPQPKLSSAEVAQPFQQMGGALKETGAALGDIAVPFAERQAAQDVMQQRIIKGPDGAPQVVNPATSLIFGDAGKAYSRAVAEGTAAQMANSVSQDATALHAANPNDPAKLRAAYDGYNDSLNQNLGNLPPQTQQLVRQTNARDQSAHLDASINEQANLRIDNDKKSILANIDNQKNIMSALAMQPGGTDSQDYKNAQAEYVRQMDALASNPLFKMPPDQIALMRKEWAGELQGLAIRAHVDETLTKSDKATAQKEAESIYTISSIPMAQRDQLYRATMAHLEYRTAEQTAEQKLDGQALESARADLVAGKLKVSDPAAIQLRAQIAKHGSGAMLNEFDGMFAAKSLLDAQRAMPTNSIAPAALPPATGDAKGNNPGNIIDGPWARSQPGYAGANGRFAAFDTLDSGAKAMGKNLSSYASQGVTSLNALTAKWAPPGDGANDPVAYARNIAAATGIDPDAKIDLSDPAIQAKIIPAMSQVEQGHAVFGGRPTGHSADRLPLSTTLSANGRPAFTQDQINANPALLTEYFKMLAEDKGTQENTLKALMDGADSVVKLDNLPDHQAVLQMAQLAEGAKPEDQMKVAGLLGKIAAVEDRIGSGSGTTLTPAQTETRVAQIREAAANSPDITQQKFASEYLKQVDESKKYAKDNPFEDAHQRFPSIPAVPALDATQPQSIAPGLAARAVVASHVENISGDKLPIIPAKDMGAVQSALQGPHGGEVLTQISQGLRPEDMSKVLQEPAFRDSVTGMSRSGDPAKMNAAYSFMDARQQENPQQFDALFKDGLKDLRAWQSSLSFYPPDVAAKRLMAQYDPQQAAALEQSRKVADEALKNVTPAQVVAKFNSGIPYTPIGTTAQPPASLMAGAASLSLKDDYAENYRDGFAATGDPKMADKFAMEKMALKYSVSPINGNRVTAYAPEAAMNPRTGQPFYPTVGGSYDWMKNQLDAEVGKALGYVKPETDPTLTLAPEQASPGAVETPEQQRARIAYQAPRALMPDQKTEADIAAGRPPSYPVILQDPSTGRWQALPAPDGTPARIRFDPSADQAAEAAKAKSDENAYFRGRVDRGTFQFGRRP